MFSFETGPPATRQQIHFYDAHQYLFSKSNQYFDSTTITSNSDACVCEWVVCVHVCTDTPLVLCLFALNFLNWRFLLFWLLRRLMQTDILQYLWRDCSFHNLLLKHLVCFASLPHPCQDYTSRSRAGCRLSSIYVCVLKTMEGFKPRLGRCEQAFLKSLFSWGA